VTSESILVVENSPLPTSKSETEPLAFILQEKVPVVAELKLKEKSETVAENFLLFPELPPPLPITTAEKHTITSKITDFNNSFFIIFLSQILQNKY
jgi:hypothetical protein